MAFPYWPVYISAKHFEEYLRFGRTHKSKTWRSDLVRCLLYIKISQLFPLDGFRFIFLLRDSENDLYFLTKI